MRWNNFEKSNQLSNAINFSSNTPSVAQYHDPIKLNYLKILSLSLSFREKIEFAKLIYFEKALDEKWMETQGSVFMKEKIEAWNTPCF